MTIHIEHHENGVRIALAGELTIYSVAEIKTALAAAIDSVVDIEIDLSEVTEVDTAGLQLMLIVKRNPGKNIRFVNPAPSVRQLIGLANVGGALGLSSFVPNLQTEKVRHEQ